LSSSITIVKKAYEREASRRKIQKLRVMSNQFYTRQEFLYAEEFHVMPLNPKRSVIGK
jgi:hypothetical protein